MQKHNKIHSKLFARERAVDSDRKFRFRPTNEHTRRDGAKRESDSDHFERVLDCHRLFAREQNHSSRYQKRQLLRVPQRNH